MRAPRASKDSVTRSDSRGWERNLEGDRDSDSEVRRLRNSETTDSTRPIAGPAAPYGRRTEPGPDWELELRREWSEQAAAGLQSSRKSPYQCRVAP
eukprot:66398-Hanusia_phi.AAC.1